MTVFRSDVGSFSGSEPSGAAFGDRVDAVLVDGRGRSVSTAILYEVVRSLRELDPGGEDQGPNGPAPGRG